MTLSILLIIPVLLVIEGLFSGSEIALMSTDRLELKKKAKKGSQGSALALRLLEHPERILSSTLLITISCAMGVSSLIAIFVKQQDLSGSSAGLISIFISSTLIIGLGEILPKTFFQRYSKKLAPRISYLVNASYWSFFPITRFLSIYTSRLTRLVGPIFDLISGKKRTSRDEIQSLLSYGRRDTGIPTEEKRMLKRIFDFKDTEAKNALIPLVKVDAIEESASIREALERFQQHRHSRMPVYSGRIDNIVGTLKFSDVIHASELNSSIRAHVKKAHFAAETQILEDLLAEMHRQKHEISTVVDEYGGAVGVLTLEDIVEEVVGEIDDEYDSRKNFYRVINDRTWWVQSRMEIGHINEILKLDLPEGDYETLGGFLLQQFGRIPEVKDELYFDTSAGALKFTIRQANDRSIESVLVERLDVVSR